MKNNKKSLITRRSLIISILTLLVYFSVFASTTWAWFSDGVSSTDNKIQAGSLSVDLELLDKETGIWNSLKESKDPIFNNERWEPGYTDVKILKIENEGTLALKWVAKFYSKHELSILADVIDVYVLQSENELNYPERSLDGYTCVGNLKTFINSDEETTYGNLEAQQDTYLGIALKMRENASNEYQGISLGGAFDIRVLATQSTYEDDSFNDQYDKDATFDDFIDTSVLESLTKTIAAEENELQFNLYNKARRIVKIIVPKSAIKDPTKPVTATIKSINPTSSVVVDKNTLAYAYDIDVTNLKDNLTEDQLVTVVVSAPNALAAMNAYHNGNVIEDAVYDDAKGTVTFKTASFSPYDFTSKVTEVSTLEALRAALNIDGNTAKLTSDIIVDLTKDTGAARDIDHAYIGNSTYYNGIKILAKNVGVDLNGHSITSYCGDTYNSNSDVGALFFVADGGSLNITNTGDVSTGFIKMASSIYAVWAPFAEPSYVDIYGGAFIADYYAGDPIGTPLDNDGNYDPVNGNMKNENSNRALIYAGFGGHINVYGGYFLYNNTCNDTSNRNNGAFNAQDFYEEDTPLLVIHEGVMLINKEYRQNPLNTSRPEGSYDNYSVKLEDETLYKISEVQMDHAVIIEGKEYSTWYSVTRAFKYMLTFKDANGNVLDTLYIKENGNISVDTKDDTAYSKLTGEYKTDFDGWVNTGSEKIETIPDNNTKDIVLYPKLKAKYTVRWVDEDGNVIHSVVTTNKTKYSSLDAPENPKSQYENMKFDHWEIRETDSNGKVTYTNVSSNYSITKDITIYPYYTYSSETDGSIALLGHDTDGDGRYDEYTVEAAAGLAGTVTIPGQINGVPVTVITDLSSDTVNGLLGDGIKSVIIKDGVKEISSNAFAGTASLNNVTVPTSVEKIGSNAFSSGWGAIISKKVTVTYAGTWEQWKAICNDNWDSGLGGGSKVICTDGEYELNSSWGTSNHDWDDWKKK